MTALAGSSSGGWADGTGTGAAFSGVTGLAAKILCIRTSKPSNVLQCAARGASSKPLAPCLPSQPKKKKKEKRKKRERKTRNKKKRKRKRKNERKKINKKKNEKKKRMKIEP